MGMAAKAGTETKKAAKKAPEKKAPAKRAAAKTTAPKKTTPEVFVSEEDCYLFGQGTHYDIYEKLGAHPSVKDGQKGYFFGVWAPNAGQVHVIGEFNGWNEEQNPMTKVGPVGIWTAAPRHRIEDSGSVRLHLARCQMDGGPRKKGSE